MEKSVMIRILLISLLFFCVVHSNDSNAQTTGPSQPEFRKFQPVDIGNVVNEFSGSFNYSIPLMIIPGKNGLDYPVVLNYSSGTSPQETASWVGFGWDLNSGAIVRNKRGYPDDYRKVHVRQWNETRPNVTASTLMAVEAQVLSKSFGQDLNLPGLGPSYSTINSFNSYKGHKNFSTLGVSAAGGKGYFKMLNGLSLKATWDSEDNGSFDIGGLSFTNIAQNYMSVNSKRNENELEKLGKTLFCTYGEFLASMVGTALFQTADFDVKNPSVSYSKFSGISRVFTPSVSFECSFVKGTASLQSGDWNYSKQTTESRDVTVCGYMYTHDAEYQPDLLMDYAIERDGEYEMRDNYLGIPFSNSDIFNVTGADVQGSFRINNNFVAWFRPGYVSSPTESESFKLDPGINLDPGWNFGAGYGHGRTELSIMGGNNFGITIGSNQYNQFRFMNDKGGALLLSDDQNLFNTENLHLYDSKTCLFFKSFYYQYRNNERSQKSTSVSYYTFRDLRCNPDWSPLIFTKDRFRAQKVSQFKGVGDDMLAGFSILTKTGNRYNYGLPVFNRREKQISYGLNSNGTINYTVPTDVPSPKLVYKNIAPLDNSGKPVKVVIGTEMHEPYAGQFLITEILSPGYIDLTGDGPTEDDIGGYVKFNYRRATISVPCSEKNKLLNEKNIPEKYDSCAYSEDTLCRSSYWYKWRTPFSGLFFMKNSCSDQFDDMGSYSSGEMEIYYLESIETPTHIAIFITNKTDIAVNLNNSIVHLTGSRKERLDGFEAIDNEYLASGDSTSSKPISGKENILQNLERILLFSKSIRKPNERINLVNGLPETRVSELIQTTYFQYDTTYPIWRNQPNSITGNGSLGGKLTLKRIWTETGDSYSAGISPYDFSYIYDSDSYPDAFTEYDNYGKHFTIDHENPSKVLSVQTPAYNSMVTDRWGSYRADGEEKTLKMEEHLNMMREGSYNFDPAAWNLKQIKLPSGAEIGIQYEQNRYCYVQDRNATIMAHFTLADDGFIVNLANEFKLDGLSTELKDSIKRSFINILNEKYVHPVSGTINNLYFKFLYALQGDANLNTVNTNNSEFINGYLKIESVEELDGYLVKLKTDLDFPREKCVQFYQGNRVGISNGQNSIPSPDFYSKKYPDLDDVQEWVNNHLTNISAGIESATLCRQIDTSQSFIRIPVTEYIPKLGGGIRVKRIIMKDNFDTLAGIDNSRITGTEYYYLTRDGKCSGVATNEPAQGKEENAIKNIILKYDDSAPLRKSNTPTSYHWGPSDLTQFEGPLGELVIPGPSVGYSNVFQKNLISGKKNGNLVRKDGGVVQKEYYTCKDFPFESNYSPIEKLRNSLPAYLLAATSELYAGASKAVSDAVTWGVNELLNDSILSTQFKFNINFTNIEYSRSQGYSFVINAMHGQPKRVGSYAGTIFMNNDIFRTEYLAPSFTSQTEYEYFDAKSPIPLYNASRDSRIFYGYRGLDQEVVTESRSVEENAYNAEGEADISFAGWFFPKYISGGGNYMSSRMKHDIYVVSKISRLPAFIKSITTTTDGVKKTIENIAFDDLTGEPLISKAVNAYIDPVSDTVKQSGKYELLNMKIPASHAYGNINQDRSDEHEWYYSNDLFRIMRRIEYNPVTMKNEYFLTYSYNIRPAACAKLPFFDTIKNKWDYSCFDTDSIYRYQIDLNLQGWESWYASRFEQGDIIRIAPNNDNQSYDYLNFVGDVTATYEYYRVIEQKGNTLKLDPLNKDKFVIYPKSKMLSMGQIVQKNTTQNLVSSFANLSLVGQNRASECVVGVRKDVTPTNRQSFLRTAFADFINYALYKKANAATQNLSLGSLLLSYDNKRGYPDTMWNSLKFEGLDSYPISINPNNIDDYIIISGSKKPISLYNGEQHFLYNDTIKIVLFPRPLVAPSNYYSSSNLTQHPFVCAANAVLDSIVNVRLDVALPEIDWLAYVKECPIVTSGNYKKFLVPMNSELEKSIKKAIGYERFASSLFYFEGNNQFFLGNDLFHIERSNLSELTVYVEPCSGKATIGMCELTHKGGNSCLVLEKTYESSVAKLKVSSYLWGFENNEWKKVSTPILSTNCANPQTIFSGLNTPLASFPNGVRFMKTDASIDFKYGNINQSLVTISNLSVISPDTIESKLTWSLKQSHDSILILDTRIPDTMKVFIYNNPNNSISLKNFRNTVEKSRWTQNKYNRRVDPVTWFSGSFSPISFANETDTNRYCFYSSIQNYAVMGAELSVYDDLWPDPDVMPGLHSMNDDDPYSKAYRGQWRMKASYAYDDYNTNSIEVQAPERDSPEDLIQGSPYSLFRTYPQLSSIENFVTGNYRDKEYSKWLRKNQVEYCLPDGRPVEITNEYGVSSTIGYGVTTKMNRQDTVFNKNHEVIQISEKDTVLRLDDQFISFAATNAKRNQVGFQSWEACSSSNISHTGSGSAIAQSDMIITAVSGITANGLFSDEFDNIVCKVWVKGENKVLPDEISLVVIPKKKTSGYDNSGIITKLSMDSVTRTGEWVLYSVVIAKNSVPGLTSLLSDDIIEIGIQPHGGQRCYIDDFSIQPSNASAIKYVFDRRNRRMKSSIDDNHFATYYIYNDEGQLNKISKESLIGYRTVAEENYNIPKKSRNSIFESASLGRVAPAKPTDQKNNNDLSNPRNITNSSNSQSKNCTSLQKNLQKINKEFFDEPRESNTNGVHSDFDIFDLRVNPENQKVEILGINTKVDSINTLYNELEQKPYAIRKGFDNTDSLLSTRNILKAVSIDSINQKVENGSSDLNSMKPDSVIKTIDKSVQMKVKNKKKDIPRHFKSEQKSVLESKVPNLQIIQAPPLIEVTDSNFNKIVVDSVTRENRIKVPERNIEIKK